MQVVSTMMNCDWEFTNFFCKLHLMYSWNYIDGMSKRYLKDYRLCLRNWKMEMSFTLQHLKNKAEALRCKHLWLSSLKLQWICVKKCYPVSINFKAWALACLSMLSHIFGKIFSPTGTRRSVTDHIDVKANSDLINSNGGRPLIASLSQLIIW